MAKKTSSHVAAEIAESLGDGSYKTASRALESRIIGVCFNRPSELQTVSACLTSEDFSDPRYRVFFEYIDKAYKSGRLPDREVCLATAKRRVDIEIEPEDYEEGLRSALENQSEIDVESACHTIHDLCVIRKLMGFAKRLEGNIAEGRSSSELIGQAEEVLRRISTDAYTGDSLLNIDQVVASSPLGVKEFTDPPLDGIPSPIAGLNEMIQGFKPGQLVIIGARPGEGKAQPLTSSVLTNEGWKQMGDLSIGEQLASIDGLESKVEGIYPQGKLEEYLITFSDGRNTKCSADHLWEVRYRDWEPRYRLMNTLELKEKLTKKRYKNRLNIKKINGEYGVRKEFKISPWLMGYLLGNGCMSRSHGSITVSIPDQCCVDRFNKEIEWSGCTLKKVQFKGIDYRISGDWSGLSNPLKDEIGRLGLIGHLSDSKFIPNEYLNTNREQRLELLRGLLDSDGTAGKNNSVQFCSTSKQLALGVQYLVRSLGGICEYGEKITHFTYKGEYKQGKLAYIVGVIMDDPTECFWLPRKLTLTSKRSGKVQQKRVTISSIEPTGKLIEMQCIKVSHPSSLYITDEFIVTHNTALVDQIGYYAAENHFDAYLFSHEMSTFDNWTRIFCQKMGILSQDFLHRSLTPMQKEKINEFINKSASRNFFISDRGGKTPLSLRAELARIKARKGKVDMVLVDYLQLMHVPGKSANRYQEVSEISRSLKQIAMEFNTRMIVAAQLNRQIDTRQGDIKPQLSDLKESGSIEQDADLVIFPHSPGKYTKKKDGVPPPDDLLIVAKQRRGPTGEVKCKFRREFFRFEGV